MGSELVSPASRLSFSQFFEDACPFYMSIGMSYDEYWNGDSTLVKYYRKAHHLKEKRNNVHAWLIGRYVYDALDAVVPALRGLSKEEVKPYLEEAYPFDKEDIEEYRKKQMREQAQRFRDYADAKNAERKKREGEKLNVCNDRPASN